MFYYDTGATGHGDGFLGTVNHSMMFGHPVHTQHYFQTFGSQNNQIGIEIYFMYSDGYIFAKFSGFSG
jgi:hypothetical protein